MSEKIFVPVSSDFKERYERGDFSLAAVDGEERAQRAERLRSIGLLAPEREGFWGGAGESFASSIVSGMEGLGRTAEELGFGSGMRETFESIRNVNQQWNPAEDIGAGEYIGRAVGGGLGSTLPTLAAATAGTLVGGPVAGTVAGISVGFSQTFGDNIQRNRQAGYSEDKAVGMAFLESSVDSIIENLPFGIVGKSSKPLFQMIGVNLTKKVGEKQAKKLLVEWGKRTLASGLGEGTEESLQYLNSYVNRYLGGDEKAEFSTAEFVDAFTQGLIAGTAFGSVSSIKEVRNLKNQQENAPLGLPAPENSVNPQTQAAPQVEVQAAPEAQMQELPQAEAVPQGEVVDVEAHDITPQLRESTSLMDNLVADVADTLGVKIGFIEDNPELAGKEDVADGMYDNKTGTIYISRENYAKNPTYTVGHELKHFIDDKMPDLSKAFDDVLEKNKKEGADSAFAKFMKEHNLGNGQLKEEFSADMFGSLFARPETWQPISAELEAQQKGMGEKFLQVLKDFIELVKSKIEQRVGIVPEAEDYLNNVNDMQKEVTRILAEVRRRNGNATQEENVIGAKGNTKVESIPVSAINVDPQRFQFKSNTNRFSGVDESNKLGGDWDARTAGNLYLWQDKSGKLYVVNGHHRLELAQRGKVENVNAIIDREADGVTAEQARRNGVLINIRDGQGDIRDYAAFVRAENLSEQEAETAGVTARAKGRAGFLLGKSGKTLYEAYQNDVITENKAVAIAEVAKGDEAIEALGIKLANDSKLSGEALRQTLKLATRFASDNKVKTEQGGLFDDIDDSVLKEWELIGKQAAKHIREVKELIAATKGANKNPEAAKRGDVSVGKKAQAALEKAQKELDRWEHYETDPELMAQLRSELGLKPAENVAPQIDEGRFEGENPLLSNEEDANDFQLVSETQAEAAKAEQKAQEAEKAEEQRIKEKAAEATADLFGAEEKATPEVKAEEKPAKVEEKTVVSEKENTTENRVKKIMALEPKSSQRLTELAYLPDGEYTFGDLTYTKQGNVFIQADGKKVSARDVSKAIAEAKAKPVEDTVSSVADIIKNLTAPQVNFSERVKLLYTLPDGKEYTFAGATYKKEYGVFHDTQDGSPVAATDIAKSIKNMANAPKADVKAEEVKAEPIAEESETVLPIGKLNQQYRNLTKDMPDRTKDIGMTYEDALTEAYETQIQASINALRKNFGNSYSFDESQALSHAMVAFATAYRTYTPERGTWENFRNNLIANSQKAYAKFMRKEQGNISSLNQVNDKGTERIDTLDVADENLNPYDDIDRQKLEYQKFFEWIDSLPDNSRDKKILQARFDRNYMPENSKSQWFIRRDKRGRAISFSDIGKMQGVGLTGEQVDARIKELFERFLEEGRYKSSRKPKHHRQVNPIIRDGVVREEYQWLLDNKEYTPETIPEWDGKAIDWITKVGGVYNAGKLFLEDKAPAERHVAHLALVHVLNSDVFHAAFTPEERVALYKTEIDASSNWGREGRAMRLDALKLDSVERVQALFDKLHEDMPEADVIKLRNQILKATGYDIWKLDKKIVDDKPQLDYILREHLAHKASWGDKAYEYWINAILSGPATHVRNIAGNTANAVYELGIKRFAEALVNVGAKRKDGASFAEFRAMAKAFNWGNAWAAMKRAYDMEMISADNKFLEGRTTSIGGKQGRIIRIPTRALAAADVLAKSLIQPMEIAAYAHRLGTSQGLQGTELENFIQKQLTDGNSKAYSWGRKRAQELTFQEDIPDFLNTLMALRESNSMVGKMMKIFLPFIKTPYNVLKQGLRKSPLGIIPLAKDTVNRLYNKKGFDGEYVAKAAEQLIAWSTVMAVMALNDDDDDKPFITGAAPAFGSGEYNFKANKVPPYSIKLLGKYWSYAGVEPFATQLGVIADGVKAVNEAQNGRDGTAIMKQLVSAVGQSITQKSFIDGIAEVIRVSQDPERELWKPVTNTAASVVPNIFRQVRQAFIDDVSDNKSRARGAEFLRDQFITVTNKMGITAALPKLDYFGREVRKDDFENAVLSPLGRLMAIKMFDADESMDKADKLIWNYNKHNPDEAYYPTIPVNTYTVNKQRYYLDGDNYRNFAKESGRLANKQINNAIQAGYLDVNNPTKKDIELIKKIFTRARKEVRTKYQTKGKKI